MDFHRSTSSRFLPLCVLGLACCWRLAPACAAVPASDVTLQPVVTDNLPVFTSLSGYTATESLASQTSPPREQPLYMPYDNTAAAWWDNLVAEQSQARLPVIMVATRGAYTLNTADTTGPGNMNPRRLTALTGALSRANATNLFKIACFVDTPAFRDISNNLHSYPSGTLMDLSVQSDWNDVFWLRGIKPWFDTVPSSYWYRINNQPVIQFWSINTAWFSNQNGNCSQILNYIAQQFQATYGETPAFILDASFFQRDPSCSTVPTVIGNNPWFAPPSQPNRFTAYNGKTFGTVVAGFINPTYFDSTSPNYQNANLVIPRKSGTTVTMETGLNNALTNNSLLTTLEGWTDVAEWAGLYRSENSNWDFPNQYINLIRRYTDLRTVTLRLEAEGCDSYSDTTTGNSGAAFRRGGDLDVRTLSSGTGWAVTNTAAGEWLEFKNVQFSSGNFKFIANYAAATANKRVQVSIDGTNLTAVTLPATANTNAFDTILLGQKTMTFGTHTIRITFLDGAVDLDWLFVRKTDPLVSLKTSGGFFVSAEKGGGDVLNGNRTVASNWEKFSFNDLNGGSLMDGDIVNIQTRNGLYLCAEQGGGGILSSNRRTPATWERFTIECQSGTGPVASGDPIALRSSNGVNYVTVGANTRLDVTGTSVGTNQTFTADLYAQ